MQININRGTWSGDCVDDNDLVLNQIKYPHIRQMLEYKDQRMITALLVNGSVGPYGIKDKPDNANKIPQLDEKYNVSGNVKDNAFRFNVMGRIQQESVILNQVGQSGSDGTFQLRMADNYLVPGMNATFFGGRLLARVASAPTGTNGNYVYTFQTPSGTVFDWNIHVAGQQGVKTCFGGYTSYSEASLRGYGRSHFPDTYINHTTIQRKTVGITGSANADVLWYEVESENGPIKGWMYEELQQARAQFLMEREYNRIWGVSTMKNADGSLRTVSRIIDHETMKPVIAGDGFEQQIIGTNEVDGSGTNGEATADDFSDMMKAMRKKSNMIQGLTYVYLTGEDGYSNAQVQMAARNTSQNIQLFRNVSDLEKPGGATPPAGVTFSSFNVDGDTVWFVKHPMFDDEKRFPERGNDGKLLMSSIYYCFTIGDGKDKTMEVMARGDKKGVNRAMVMAEFNGMTGSPGTIVSEEDAKKYAMLNEDLLVLFNAQQFGIINKAA